MKRIITARITTAAALRALAKKIIDTTKGVPADEPYFVDLDTELSKIENMPMP